MKKLVLALGIVGSFSLVVGGSHLTKNHWDQTMRGLYNSGYTDGYSEARVKTIESQGVVFSKMLNMPILEKWAHNIFAGGCQAIKDVEFVYSGKACEPASFYKDRSIIYRDFALTLFTVSALGYCGYKISKKVCNKIKQKFDEYRNKYIDAEEVGEQENK